MESSPDADNRDRTHDQLALELDLRVEADLGHGAFRATIKLSAIDFAVVVIERDLVSAVRNAAQLCSERLREREYEVGAEQVLGALEVMEEPNLSDALRALIDMGRA